MNLTFGLINEYKVPRNWSKILHVKDYGSDSYPQLDIINRFGATGDCN